MTLAALVADAHANADGLGRSEEHTSELQSRLHLVCRLLLEKKNDLPVVRRTFADSARRSPRSAPSASSWRRPRTATASSPSLWGGARRDAAALALLGAPSLS